MYCKYFILDCIYLGYIILIGTFCIVNIINALKIDNFPLILIGTFCIVNQGTRISTAESTRILIGTFCIVNFDR